MPEVLDNAGRPLWFRIGRSLGLSPPMEKGIKCTELDCPTCSSASYLIRSGASCER